MGKEPHLQPYPYYVTPLAIWQPGSQLELALSALMLTMPMNFLRSSLQSAKACLLL